MIPVSAVIPTRFGNYLPNLIPKIIHDVTDIYIMDNGLEERAKHDLSKFPKVTIIPCYDRSIYQMWNYGMDITVKNHGQDSYTAILNDDIDIIIDTIGILAGFLDYYSNLVAICPDYSLKLEGGFNPLHLEYVTSTFGHNGLAGFAFVIKNSYNIRVDENFKWWYGDDDLVKSILASGGTLGKVIGLPIEHNQGMSFNHLKEQLKKQIILDRLYFNSKYGENRA